VNNTYKPDWLSPPGDTIADLIEELGWSHKDLANSMSFTEVEVSNLIKGTKPLTYDIAVKLVQLLGGTIEFWLKREANYRKGVL